MKLVSYLKDGHDQLAILYENYVYDMDRLHPDLPGNMSLFLNYWDESYDAAQRGFQSIQEGHVPQVKARQWKACSF